MENLPIYQIHGAFDDYPFPYDDAARVFITMPTHGKTPSQDMIFVVMPDGGSGAIFSAKGNHGCDWVREDNGYRLFPHKEHADLYSKDGINLLSHFIHCAVTALRMVSAFNLPRVEAQKRDVKRATKGLKPETKTDKYYILKLSGRSLNYLPEPQGKCRATGIKQRWHMCRGHYRHLKSGKVVFVRGHYRGDKALGIVHKDYSLS